MVKFPTDGLILTDEQLAELAIPVMIAWLDAFDYDCKNYG